MGDYVKKYNYRDALHEMVHMAAKHEGVTMNDWLKAHGLSDSIIHDQTGSGNMRVSTIERVTDALGITLEDFLRMVWGIKPLYCRDKRTNTAPILYKRIQIVIKDAARECGMTERGYLELHGIDIDRMRCSIYRGFAPYTNMLDKTIEITGVDPRRLFAGL